MNDSFICNLQGDWQSQDHDAARVLRRLRRNRWIPHIVLGTEILGCAFALLVGVWFAWIAAHTEKLLFALSAAPALCIASVMARRHSLAWDVETPESLLRVAIRRAEASLRAIRIGRWHIAIIAAFVITLWMVEALRFIHAIGFLMFYTTVCVVVSVASWLWMAWREKRVRGEHAACVRLLATLQVDNEMDPESSDLIAREQRRW
jgi:hypothetical protein